MSLPKQYRLQFPVRHITINGKRETYDTGTLLIK